jgi:hypothetical protein
MTRKIISDQAVTALSLAAYITTRAKAWPPRFEGITKPHAPIKRAVMVSLSNHVCKGLATMFRSYYETVCTYKEGCHGEPVEPRVQRPGHPASRVLRNWVLIFCG